MSGTFSEWTDRLRVQNEYITALGGYKLRRAQAEVLEAEKQNLMAVVQAKRQVVRQIQRDLRIYNAERNSRIRQREETQRRIKYAEMLLRGRRISSQGFQTAWRAYQRFETPALLASGDEILSVKVPKSARRESNFVAIKENRDVVAVPDEIQNGLQLMHWLKEKWQIAVSGSDAFRVVLKVFEKINQVAEKQNKDLNDRLDRIRKDTFDPWDLNAILGVEGSAAAKKIASAGAST